MSKLKAVAPKTAEPQKPKILIFGKAGVGKTWASLDFPKVYYVDSEGGATRNHYTDKLEKAGGVYLGTEQGAGNFDDVLEQVKALATEKHDYKTLVIDSFTQIFQNEVAKEAEKLGDKDAFGASKKPAIAKSRALIGWLNRLDMNVILICHEKQLYEKGESVGFTFDGYEKIEYLLDLSMQIIKQGVSRKAKVIKSRLESFPEATTIEWSYDEFAKRYGKEVIEKAGKPIELASVEQVARLNELLEVVRLPDGTFEGWLEKAGAASVEELDSDKAEKIITALTKKVSK